MKKTALLRTVCGWAVLVFAAAVCSGEERVDSSAWVHPMHWSPEVLNEYFEADRVQRDATIERFLAQGQKASAAQWMILDGQAGWALETLQGVESSAARKNSAECFESNWLRGTAAYQVGRFRKASEFFASSALSLLKSGNEEAAFRSARDASFSLARVEGHKPALALWRRVLAKRAASFEARVRSAIWLARADYYAAAFDALPKFVPEKFEANERWHHRAERLRGFLLQQLGRYSAAQDHAQKWLDVLVAAIDQQPDDALLKRQLHFAVNHFATTAFYGKSLGAQRDWLQDLALRFPNLEELSVPLDLMDHAVSMDSPRSGKLSAELADTLEQAVKQPAPQKTKTPKVPWRAAASWNTVYDHGERLAAPDSMSADDFPRVRAASWLQWHGQPEQAVVQLQNQLSQTDAAHTDPTRSPKHEFEALYKYVHGLVRREGPRRYERDASLSGFWLWLVLDDTLEPTTIDRLSGELFASQQNMLATIPWLWSAHQRGSFHATKRLAAAFEMLDWSEMALAMSEQLLIREPSPARFGKWVSRAFYLNCDEQILAALRIVAKHDVYRNALFRELDLKRGAGVVLQARRLVHMAIPDDPQQLARYLDVCWRLGHRNDSLELADLLLQEPVDDDAMSESALAFAWDSYFNPIEMVEETAKKIYAGPDSELWFEEKAEVHGILRQRLLAWTILHALADRSDSRIPDKLANRAAAILKSFDAQSKLLSRWDSVLRAAVSADDSALLGGLKQLSENGRPAAAAWIVSNFPSRWETGERYGRTVPDRDQRIRAVRRLFAHLVKTKRGESIWPRRFRRLTELAGLLPDVDRERSLRELQKALIVKKDDEDEVEESQPLVFVDVDGLKIPQTLIRNRSAFTSITRPDSGSFLILCEWLKTVPVEQRGAAVRRLLRLQIESHAKTLQTSRGCSYRGTNVSLYIHREPLIEAGFHVPPEHWMLPVCGLINADLLASMYIAVRLSPSEGDDSFANWLKQQQTRETTVVNTAIWDVLECRRLLLHKDKPAARRLLAQRLSDSDERTGRGAVLVRSLLRLELFLLAENSGRLAAARELEEYPATRWVSTLLEYRLAKMGSSYDALDHPQTRRVVDAWRRCFAMGFASDDIESLYGRTTIQESLSRGYLADRLLKDDEYSPWSGFYRFPFVPIHILQKSRGMSADEIRKFARSRMQESPRRFTHLYGYSPEGYFESEDSKTKTADWMDLVELHPELALKCVSGRAFGAVTDRGKLNIVFDAIADEFDFTINDPLPSVYMLRAVVERATTRSLDEKQTAVLQRVLARASDLQMLAAMSAWPVEAFDLSVVQDRLMELLPLRNWMGPFRRPEKLLLMQSDTSGMSLSAFDVWLDRPSMIARYGELIEKLTQAVREMSPESAAANHAILAVLQLRNGEVTAARESVGRLVQSSDTEFSPSAREWLAARIGRDSRMDSVSRALIESVLRLPDVWRDSWSTALSEISRRDRLRTADRESLSSPPAPVRRSKTMNSKVVQPLTVAQVTKEWDELTDDDYLFEGANILRNSVEKNLLAERPDLALAILHKSLRHKRAVEHLSYTLAEEPNIAPRIQIRKVTAKMDPLNVAEIVAQYLVPLDPGKRPGMFPLIVSGAGLSMRLSWRYFSDPDQQAIFSRRLSEILRARLAAEPLTDRRALIRSVLGWFADEDAGAAWSIDEILAEFPTPVPGKTDPNLAASALTLIFFVDRELRQHAALTDAAAQAIPVLLLSAQELGDVHFEAVFAHLARWEEKHPGLSRLLRAVRDFESSGNTQPTRRASRFGSLLISDGMIQPNSSVTKRGRPVWADLGAIPADQIEDAAKVFRSFLFGDYRTSISSAKQYATWRHRVKRHAPQHDFDALVVSTLTSGDKPDSLVFGIQPQSVQYWVMGRTSRENASTGGPWGRNFDDPPTSFCLLEHALTNIMKDAGYKSISHLPQAVVNSPKWKQTCLKILLSRLRKDDAAVENELEQLAQNWPGELDVDAPAKALALLNNFAKNSKHRNTCLQVLTRIPDDVRRGQLRDWSRNFQYMSLRAATNEDARGKAEREILETERSYSCNVACGWELCGHLLAKSARLSCERAEWQRGGRFMRAAIPRLRVKNAWNMMYFLIRRTQDDPAARFEFFTGLTLGDSEFTPLDSQFYAWIWDRADPSPDGLCAPAVKPITLFNNPQQAVCGIHLWLQAAQNSQQLPHLRKVVSERLEWLNSVNDKDRTKTHEGGRRFLQRVLWFIDLLEENSAPTTIASIPDWHSLDKNLDYATALTLGKHRKTAAAFSGWLRTKTARPDFSAAHDSIGTGRLERCIRWFVPKQDAPQRSPEWLSGWTISGTQFQPVTDLIGTRLVSTDTEVTRRIGPENEQWQHPVEGRRWTLKIATDKSEAIRELRIDWAGFSLGLNSDARNHLSVNYVSRHFKKYFAGYLSSPDMFFLRRSGRAVTRTQLLKPPTELEICRDELRLWIRANNRIITACVLPTTPPASGPLRLGFETGKPVTFTRLEFSNVASEGADVSNLFETALPPTGQVEAVPVPHAGWRP